MVPAYLQFSWLRTLRHLQQYYWRYWTWWSLDSHQRCWECLQCLHHRCTLLLSSHLHLQLVVALLRWNSNMDSHYRCGCWSRCSWVFHILVLGYWVPWGWYHRQVAKDFSLYSMGADRDLCPGRLLPLLQHQDLCPCSQDICQGHHAQHENGYRANHWLHLHLWVPCLLCILPAILDELWRERGSGNFWSLICDIHLE